MGESACLLHAFSYPSGVSDEPKLGNPMLALGESVSFGRFKTESLSWDKWSVFSHNRYVEDAQRYAQPGSVAQKKAFFEAHYKKIASKKKEAAALTEQENTNPELEPEPQACDISNSHVAIDEQQLEVKEQETKDNSSGGPLEVGVVKEAEAAVDHEIRLPIQNETSDAVSDVLEKNGISEVELGESPQIEKPLLEGFKDSQEDPCHPTKKKPAIPPSKPSIQKKEPRIPAPPAKPPLSRVHSKKENNVTPNIRNSPKDSLDRKKPTSKSLHSLIYSTPAGQELHKSTAPQVSKSCQATPSEAAISKKKPAFSSSKTLLHHREPRVPAIAPRQTATTQAKKEKNVTGNTTMDNMDRKRSTSRSLRTLIYPPAAKEPEKPTTPVARKAESSRVTPSTRKESKTTPLRPLPVMVSATGESKNTSATTPCSENRSCSKSSSTIRKKLQSPNLSTPFRLKTEERAARRKQKLEEKFNAKDTEKVQLQTRLKEKAGIELRKWRQGLCFKARPLPDFYKDKERETTKVQIKNTKIPLTQPQSPKLGRKSSTSTFQASQPQETQSTKNGNPKIVVKKKNQNQKIPRSFPSDENKSPNISAVIS